MPELPSKYLENFSEACRQSGDELFQRHSVVILLGSSDMVSAEITDNQGVHETTWEIIDHRLVPHCDCIQFSKDHVLCDHLWASLLAADSSGDLLNAIKKNIPRRITIVIDSSDALEAEYQPLDNRKRRRSTSFPSTSGMPYLDSSESQIQPAAPANTSSMSVFASSGPQQADILFILDIEKQHEDELVLNLAWRPFAKTGEPLPPAKTLTIEPGFTIDSKPLYKALSWSKTSLPSSSISLPSRHISGFLDMLDEHNLLRWKDNLQIPKKIHPVQIIMTPGLAVQPLFKETSDSTHPFSVTGIIPLPEEDISLQNVLFAWESGVLLTRDRIIVAKFNNQYNLIRDWISTPPHPMTLLAARELARTLILEGGFTQDYFPQALRPELLEFPVKGHLFVRTAVYKYRGHEQLHAELSFSYNGTAVSYGDESTDVRDERSQNIIHRNFPVENALVLKLQELGFRWNDDKASEEIGWKLSPAQLDAAVRQLVMDDWEVTAQGKNYRKPITKTAVIVSHADWFDLEASVQFDSFTVPLPALLEAKRNGRNAVQLGDGTFGLLPIDWLENFTALTELGDQASEKIRFKQQQAAIISELLEGTQTQFDAAFSHHVTELADIQPRPATPPPSFQAILRPYQQQGLGWLLAMNRRGLGACLADDMGLGKTVQILSLLATRQAEGVDKPSLIIMPKSLLFNWQNEIQKFAPTLTFLTYTGAFRQRLLKDFPFVNLVLTTYGTLRNDVTILAQQQFDYCILDESQAIKNADSSTAESCRAIRADYRIAMTGTPIENKLAELFSQLDFLNPGLLGKLIKDATTGSSRLPPETFRKVRQAVRTFILRRTKQMVARDLPPKTEQILWVELDEKHQAEYNALREHYRKKLLDASAESSSMDTLAALLRLRQAACHPALVFQNREHDESEKLEQLCEELTVLTEQGHKALVFSQFTSLLKLVKDKLTMLAIPFAYLDGQTQNRQEVVQEFQQNESIKVFLISLKAGGVGLNLTAADYIFILDPWWNPATEAQAIDRAYRIGQTKPVVAYKMITRNTIEEKVLQMQEQKRRLATTYLKETPMPARLSQEDLSFLLEP